MDPRHGEEGVVGCLGGEGELGFGGCNWIYEYYFWLI